MEIRILREVLTSLSGAIFLEFNVPRLGSRIDAVLVSGAAIFPIEFKCGETNYKIGDYNQAWDYALDLKNFHQASHDAPIWPVLVATEAASSDDAWAPTHPDGVRPPRRCRAADIRVVLDEGLGLSTGVSLDPDDLGVPRHTTPPPRLSKLRELSMRDTQSWQSPVTTLERRTFASRRRRSKKSLSTLVTIGEKAIVFVTGVPGAGKTLVGLNVATRRREFGDARAVYLSGNGPLVMVLHEALTRDELARSPKRTRKGEIRQRVKPFIQNIHHFRDEGVRSTAAPYDHVVIFDEAQRAWDIKKTADFMKRRKKILNFGQSEPEFLIHYLDRHQEWAVIVCLVGGGQEINHGEAGIAEWLEAVRKSFRHWHVYISPQLTDSEYTAASSLEKIAVETPGRAGPAPSSFCINALFSF